MGKTAHAAHRAAMSVASRFRKPTLVLDFDGTLTDVYGEARGYSTTFAKNFLAKLAKDPRIAGAFTLTSLTRRVDQEKKRILANPESAWVVGQQSGSCVLGEGMDFSGTSIDVSGTYHRHNL